MKVSKSKVALVSIVVESSLGKSDKLELVDFIEKMDQTVADQLINVNEVEKYMSVRILLTNAKSLGRLSYNRYMIDGARACRDREGEEKTACMRGYKDRALKAKLDALRKNSAKCSQTMDQSNCREQFTKAIRSVENQIRALR